MGSNKKQDTTKKGKVKINMVLKKRAVTRNKTLKRNGKVIKKQDAEKKGKVIKKQGV